MQRPARLPPGAARRAPTAVHSSVHCCACVSGGRVGGGGCARTPATGNSSTRARGPEPCRLRRLKPRVVLCAPGDHVGFRASPCRLRPPTSSRSSCPSRRCSGPRCLTTSTRYALPAIPGRCCLAQRRRHNQERTRNLRRGLFECEVLACVEAVHQRAAVMRVPLPGRDEEGTRRRQHRERAVCSIHELQRSTTHFVFCVLSPPPALYLALPLHGPGVFFSSAGTHESISALPPRLVVPVRPAVLPPLPFSTSPLLPRPLSLCCPLSPVSYREMVRTASMMTRNPPPTTVMSAAGRPLTPSLPGARTCCLCVLKILFLRGWGG